MVDVNEHNLDMTIELEVTDTITITVDDGDDTPTAIEGAKVVIGETEKTTIQFRSNHKSFTISLTASGG